MKESLIQDAILDWLQAKRILAFRMQVGAMSAEHNGKKRFMRFGVAGMADILAFPIWHDCGKAKMGHVLWIECKSTKDHQSPFQKSFQDQVQNYGHRYIVARSIEDVEEALK